MTADHGLCQYSAAHFAREVPAVTIIDCGPFVGRIPACQDCADFYHQHAPTERDSS